MLTRKKEDACSSGKFKEILARRVSPMRGEWESVSVSPESFGSVWEYWEARGIGAHTGNMKTGTTLRQVPTRD